MTVAEVWTLVLSGIAALAFIGVPLSAWAIVLHRRAEKRALEPRDVVWSATRFDGDPAWYFSHSGTADALSVKIDLTIDGRTSTARFERVKPDTPVSMTHQWHSELLEQAEAEERQYQAELEASSGERDYDFGPAGIVRMPAIGGPVSVPAMAYRAEASFVITWRSRLEVPGRQERGWTETY